MDHQSDWRRVVYGSGGASGPEGAESGSQGVLVRQVPLEPDLAGAPRREQKVRVTVLPGAPGQTWALWLTELDEDEAGPRGRIWWRLEPGTWQPLGRAGQCVAEGRGRVRLDVSLRLSGRAPVRCPRLRFVAEATGDPSEVRFRRPGSSPSTGPTG